jgi:hypothetical protein
MLCNGPWRAASTTLGSLGSDRLKNARLSSPKVTLLSTQLSILATLLSRAKILNGVLGVFQSRYSYVSMMLGRRGDRMLNVFLALSCCVFLDPHRFIIASYSVAEKFSSFKKFFFL